MSNIPCFRSAEVSASFRSETSLRYSFREKLLNDQPSSKHSDWTLRAENISLSFRTSQSPALLLYADSYDQEYLALLLSKHGERSALGEVCLFSRCFRGFSGFTFSCDVNSDSSFCPPSPLIIIIITHFPFLPFTPEFNQLPTTRVV